MAHKKIRENEKNEGAWREEEEEEKMCVKSDGSRVSHTLQNPGGNDDAMLEVDKLYTRSVRVYT